MSSRVNFSGEMRAGACGQWAFRFCLSPETLPVFCSWVRSIWPECPFDDAELADELAQCHDLYTEIIRALGRR